MEEMTAFEELENQLQDALAHVHDCAYQPAQLLYDLTDRDPRNGAAPVQAVLLKAIDDLQPDADVPPGAYSRRVYEVLHHRYTLKLTLEETAELQNLSIRQLTRVQRDAIHTLATVLWERSRVAGLSPGDGSGEDGEAADARGPASAQAADWHAQMRRELASLEKSAPGVVADVGEAIDDVMELRYSLAPEERVRVERAFTQEGLVAAVHPSALRQMLLTALGQLAHYTSDEPITIVARLEGGNAKITLVGALAEGLSPTEDTFTENVLVPPGASVVARIDNGRVFLWLELPSQGRKTVLVVDDNPDMARFYQRAAEGTRYRIVHVAQGREVAEAVETFAPDAIVLDVMLPDVDGWRLLMHLHENPATRSVPVVVCSVVREENLALSLGAVRYLPKPVRPRQFTEVLDQVLARA